MNSKMEAKTIILNHLILLGNTSKLAVKKKNIDGQIILKNYQISKMKQNHQKKRVLLLTILYMKANIRMNIHVKVVQLTHDAIQ